MATATPTTTAAMAGATANSTSTKVSSQGGIFEGLNPSVYNPADPIVLFIIQASIVISLTRLLYWPLSKIKEPKVIAEVLAGILLGPSVLGRIPGFSETIFPPNGMGPFRLAANIGLTLYLFLVGLEINMGYLLSNWRIAASVACLDMTIPFGLGVAVAWGLYKDFADEPGIRPISFGLFALFVGVATAITAFPVLCRILTSLKLLNTTVGVIVMTSGIANDVVGWVLLALCVTLVNSGAGITALYIILVAAGYSLFLAYGVRPVFMWVLRRTRSLENGPSQSIVALTIFMVLASAFFTDIIGVHSIFGAFVIGLMCPHEGGFAIKLTEKIEDLVAVLFLPLFFALSGINTNIGLLNTGKTWGYVFAIIFVAFFSKLAGGTLGARANGLVWRESFTIGTLMSCKGLVELIVLNIGLQAKILSTRTFTMFVVMALITTFATTPLVSWLYPPSYQRKLELWKKGKIDWDGNPLMPADGTEDERPTDVATRLLVYLRADGLSSVLSIIGHFAGKQQAARPEPSAESEGAAGKEASERPAPLRVHGYRLVELSERNSSVMAVSEIEEYAAYDPIVKALGTCANNAGRDVMVSGQIAVVPEDSFADALATEATKASSDLIIVPWSETGTISEISSGSVISARSKFDVLANNHEFAGLAAQIFEKARPVSAVAVFLDESVLRIKPVSASDKSPQQPQPRLARQLTKDACGVSVSDVYDPPMVRLYSAESRGGHFIRVLYTGTQDDMHAVRLALQLAAQNEDVEVTVVEVSDAVHHEVAEEDYHKCCFDEFVKTKATALAKHGERVRFAEEKNYIDSLASVASSTSVLEVMLTAPAGTTGSGATVTVMVGRSVIGTGRPSAIPGAEEAESSSGYTVDLKHALGGAAAAVATEIRNGHVNASLLVVQAKAKAALTKVGTQVQVVSVEGSGEK
ncbi:Sodium/hydrogen exchanger family-domain-containing protein [Apodospora peruviana]|uniref:Sodium/hydrogen exchanger family-domain-containing protein n=1 Tax=Apodospora peruviana TaxID=516989 RepID=A0AAE0HU82_9PEZI|nr:Sodium/hydrogen exchanger family-domain-containing protein [Apodospora peruviana]